MWINIKNTHFWYQSINLISRFPGVEDQYLKTICLILHFLSVTYTSAPRMVKSCPKFVCSIAIIFTCCTVFAQQGRVHQNDTAQPQAKKFQFNTIIVDAGHGGKDPGARGAYSFEKNVALAIAKKLRNAINEQLPAIKVVMTRSTDVFIELHRRTEIGNAAKGNLFISIHCNSNPQRVGTENGPLLLVYGFHRSEEQLEAIRENAAIYIEKDYKNKYDDYDANDPTTFIMLNNIKQTFRKECIHFADLVNREFKETDDRHSHGVKEQGVLVLAHSAMPAVLVENRLH